MVRGEIEETLFTADGSTAQSPGVLINTNNKRNEGMINRITECDD